VLPTIRDKAASFLVFPCLSLSEARCGNRAYREGFRYLPNLSTVGAQAVEGLPVCVHEEATTCCCCIVTWETRDTHMHMCR
jgi:hypothetical protein